MAHLFSLFVMAVAVSLDGFGVGMTYGLRKIRIPVTSVAIIALFSGIVIYLSMQIGTFAARMFSPELAKSVGAVILIGIGFWAILQLAMQKDQDKAHAEHTTGKTDRGRSPAAADVLRIELKRLGLVIQILRTPRLADVDRSGNISSSEAALLGLALSLDAFGAGIGAALIGFTPWLTAAAIALSSAIFLSVGLRTGYRYSELAWLRRISALPGCILIAIGILRLM